MLPMVREAAEGVVLTLPWEDVCADIVGAPSFKILDHRQPNGTDGFTLLTVLQPQAARLGVGLRPFQADHLAAPAPVSASWRMMSTSQSQLMEEITDPFWKPMPNQRFM